MVGKHLDRDVYGNFYENNSVIRDKYDKYDRENFLNKDYKKWFKYKSIIK